MWAGLSGLSTVGLFQEAEEEGEQALKSDPAREKHPEGRQRAAAEIRKLELILVIERPPLSCVSVPGDTLLLSAVTEGAAEVRFRPLINILLYSEKMPGFSCKVLALACF